MQAHSRINMNNETILVINILLKYVKVQVLYCKCPWVFHQMYICLYLLAAEIKDSLDKLSNHSSFLVVTLLIKSLSNQINQVMRFKNFPNW